MKSKLKIIDAAYHRNGICGEGFYAIIFDDKEYGRMYAALFRTYGYCAVVNVEMLAKNNIKFAQNSWRGDEYACELRPLLKKWLQKKNDDMAESSFFAPQNIDEETELINNMEEELKA